MLSRTEPGHCPSLSRFHSGSVAACRSRPEPAGYHSGHVAACSSNEKCLTVNETNTDIRLAQQELRGKERVREREEKKSVGGRDGGGEEGDAKGVSCVAREDDEKERI